MTADHLLSILPKMRERDRFEILNASRYPSLSAWAKSRVEAPGVSWTLLVNGVPVWCGGVLDGAVEGIGALWLVGTNEAARYAKHVLRVWKVIRQVGGYRRLECKCYADNVTANKFAERVGFRLEGTLRGYGLGGEDLNQYGIGGQHGR